MSSASRQRSITGVHTNSVRYQTGGDEHKSDGAGTALPVLTPEDKRDGFAVSRTSPGEWLQLPGSEPARR